MFCSKMMVLVFVAMLLGCSAKKENSGGGALLNETPHTAPPQVESDAEKQARMAVAEIDRIHGMDIPESEKEQKAKQHKRKLSNLNLRRTEKSLLLLELSEQTRTRAAWISCITRANSIESCVIEMTKEILRERDDLDEKQRILLYSHIGRAGSGELPYLEGEHQIVKSDEERAAIAFYLATYGSKVGVPSLIKAYESDGRSEGGREIILGLFRKLYKTDAGSDIETWKVYIREHPGDPEE